METTSAEKNTLMYPDPSDGHRWLQKLLGEWKVVHEPSEEGGEAPSGEWTERIRQVGDLWVVAEAEGVAPDGVPAHTLMTLGYDPARRRFTGTWIGSMMTHLWIYDGGLDETEKVLTLDCEGPDFDKPESMRRYQDVFEMESDDDRLHRALIQEEDGSWTEMMRVRYRRVR